MEQISFEDLGVQIVDVPEFDKSLLKGIKGLSEITPKLPRYRVTFKRPMYRGLTDICVYVGYWHGLTGWNYEQKDVKSYERI